MPASKVLVLVCCKKINQCILQVKLLQMPRRFCGNRVRIACSGLGNGEIPSFLYASHFILETDQKLLEAILSKSLNQATPRLQQILIRTFAYHFTVRCIPGNKDQLADCLSPLDGHKDTTMLPKLHIHQITNQLSTRSDSLNQMRIATQKDDELALLKHTITQGWPNTIREVQSKIQPYWTFREELTVKDGIILKGTWIVVPHKKCQATLQLIHS